MFYRKTTGFSPEHLSMSGDYAYITTPDGKTSVIKPKFRNFFTFSEIGKEMKSEFSFFRNGHLTVFYSTNSQQKYNQRASEKYNKRIYGITIVAPSDLSPVL